jgi:hypothetical protein
VKIDFWFAYATLPRPGSAVRSFSHAEVLKITNAVSVLGLDLADFEVSPLMVSGSELEGLDVQAPWQAAAPAHASAT